jgi:Mlc titration factor MtfA (ptsG expression regulator)
MKLAMFNLTDDSIESRLNKLLVGENSIKSRCTFSYREKHKQQTFYTSLVYLQPLMILAFQICFVLLLIILVIVFVFQPRHAENFALPDNYQELLNDYVTFYFNLNEEGKKGFEVRLQKFLSAVKITGAGAEVEDIDRVLIGAAAVIPVYFIPDWEYVNLKEVLVYPGNFNTDYEQHGNDRTISGMVGTGSMENVMILSKWELRQGFVNSKSNHNTAIHEFVHLIDKMDGTLDGVPELLLERKYVAQWQQLLEATMDGIRRDESDIDSYAATSPVECFAVVAEYFFEQPEAFRLNHPVLNEMLQRIFVRK